MLDLHRLRYSDAYAKREFPEGAPAPPAVRGIQDYVDHRTDRVAEIAEATGAGSRGGEALPNVIANGGTSPRGRATTTSRTSTRPSPRSSASGSSRTTCSCCGRPSGTCRGTRRRGERSGQAKGGRRPERRQARRPCFALVLQTRENEVLARMDRLFLGQGLRGDDACLRRADREAARLALHGTETPEELQAMQKELVDKPRSRSGHGSRRSSPRKATTFGSRSSRSETRRDATRRRGRSSRRASPSRRIRGNEGEGGRGGKREREDGKQERERDLKNVAMATRLLSRPPDAHSCVVDARHS